MASTAVAKITPKQVHQLMLVDSVRERLAPMLRQGDKLERIAQIAMLEASRNPSLLNCSGMSIVDSIARIMSWGLEVGETAYLVPFGNTCQAVKGYQGLIQLMYDSGHVRGVNAFVVHEKDEFSYEYGLNPILKHVPSNDKKPGAVTHAYCVIRLAFQHKEFRVMTYDEVDAIRQKYSKQWKAGVAPDWYLLKTVIIHTSKLLPKNSKFAAIHDAMRRAEADEIEVAETEVEHVEASAVPENVDPETGEDLLYGNEAVEDDRS
jgi:recombination protein RecT